MITMHFRVCKFSIRLYVDKFITSHSTVINAETGFISTFSHLTINGQHYKMTSKFDYRIDLLTHKLSVEEGSQ